MVVYSSINVPGTEFTSLEGPLPTCLNTSERHVVGSNMIMRPAVIENGGEIFIFCDGATCVLMYLTILFG